MRGEKLKILASFSSSWSLGPTHQRVWMWHRTICDLRCRTMNTPVVNDVGEEQWHTLMVAYARQCWRIKGAQSASGRGMDDPHNPQLLGDQKSSSARIPCLLALGEIVCNHHHQREGIAQRHKCLTDK